MSDKLDTPRPRREIRSFVIRDGRITPGQIKALEQQWPGFGLELKDGLISADTFTTPQPITLEIGFGMGDSLFEMATLEPGNNFIGVEVHRPGVGHLLQLAAKANLENLKIYREDSLDVLGESIPLEFLDRIQIFFPDPWHKKKHHKRRLISPEFVKLLATKLKASGVLHIATDWAPYAEVIQEVMSDWTPTEIPSRPVTKYEKRGIRLDHEVFDFAYRKPAPR